MVGCDNQDVSILPSVTQLHNLSKHSRVTRFFARPSLTGLDERAIFSSLNPWDVMRCVLVKPICLCFKCGKVNKRCSCGLIYNSISHVLVVRTAL